MVEKIGGILSAFPSEAWTGLIGVVTGAIISIFGVWLTNRSNTNQLHLQLEHEKQSRSEELKRERLEELYILVEHWLTGLFKPYISLSMVMKGKLNYNQHLDQEIKSGKNHSHDFHRLEMILDIYACELKPTYKKVIEAREECHEISSKHKQAYERGDIEGERFLEPYTKAQEKIISLGETLKKEIAEYAKIA